MARRGLIPAHAGKTGALLVPMVGAWAHPRSRGENGILETRFLGRAGSSPLTRGKHDRAVMEVAAERLIPAHAGKTSGAWSARWSPWAHPRSRGEN